jgi:hypothetical protein
LGRPSLACSLAQELRRALGRIDTLIRVRLPCSFSFQSMPHRRAGITDARPRPRPFAQNTLTHDGLRLLQDRSAPDPLDHATTKA